MIGKKKKARKERLDKLVVANQLAPTIERARALILAGKVIVGDHTHSKAGTHFLPSVEITLKGAAHPYVSRGGLKLEKALKVFGVAAKGKVALDIGASTGGFTDVLLRHGAARVYAIDVGYGQLAWRLRQDPRVVVLERENFRHLEPDKISEPADLAVIDVSFISLTKILGKTAQLLGPQQPVVCLIKPQFEVGNDRIDKGGVVRDPAAHRLAIDIVKNWATEHSFAVCGLDQSPITGPAGNIEFLLHLETPE